MTKAHGQQGGHRGFSWADYVDWIATEAGSLATAAERLSARKGYDDDIESIERGLRRLRGRAQEEGGKWGERALAVFGLPAAAEARSRWMGSYHSRFTDLPVSVCEDLLRFWDRPPLNQTRSARTWISLGHTSCALRRNDLTTAAEHLEQARLTAGNAGRRESRIEILLVAAFIASRREPARVDALHTEAGKLIASGDLGEPDFACLHARWIDQRAYQLNKGRSGATDYAGAEALYRTIPAIDVPAFAVCRRANGLAFASWKQGRIAEGATFAREAVSHAGDAGHLRLRAMALSMLARIVEGDEGVAARRRAREIANTLDDATLRDRLGRDDG